MQQDAFQAQLPAEVCAWIGFALSPQLQSLTAE